MLKATILTCAIIAAQPLVDGAQAGENLSGSLSLQWTGRFVDVTKAPALGSLMPPGEPKPPRNADSNDDPDVVGSIPPSIGVRPGYDNAVPHGRESLSLCTLPGLATGAAPDSLACGGAYHNRWSANASTFNYDLSKVKPEFANAPTPFGGWGPSIGSRP